MLGILKRLALIVMIIVLGVLGVAVYGWLASTGIIGAPDGNTPDITGMAASAGKYLVILVVVVVAYIALRGSLRRYRNTHVGVTRWRD